MRLKNTIKIKVLKIYINEHVKSLKEIEHKLGKIVFVFNLEEEHRELFEKLKMKYLIK